MNNYEFEVNENFELYIFNKDQQSEPIIFQPCWPNGSIWNGKEEAEDWALAYIKSATDNSFEFIPGDGPDNPLLPKPEQIIEIEALITEEPTE